MNGDAILVTGASGFIGGHVARWLHAEGIPVLATGRNRTALAQLERDGIRCVDADLACDPLDPLLCGVKRIVHAAALSTPWGPRDAFIRANVTATERLLQAAARQGITHVVHLGSPSIYFRPQDQLQLDECFQPPTRWITHYAESKWLSEEVVRHACSASVMTGVILRPRAVFGAGDAAIFPRIVQRAGKGRFPLVNGGRAIIDITAVENVVQAVWRALQSAPTDDVPALNISNGEPLPVKTILDRLFDALGMRVQYRNVPRGLGMALAGVLEGIAKALPGQPEPPVSRYTLGVLAYSQTLDIASARRHLGYQPTLGVLEGIDRFAQQWRAHARA